MDDNHDQLVDVFRAEADEIWRSVERGDMDRARCIFNRLQRDIPEFMAHGPFPNIVRHMERRLSDDGSE